MMRGVRCVFLAACVLWFAGCASPMLGYTLDVPAMVQSPVRAAGIVDERPRFRQLFCTLMQRDHASGAEDCDIWLQRFADEAPRRLDTMPAARAPASDVIIVGGIFGECLPDVHPFGDAVAPLKVAGYRISYAPVKGRGSSDLNAAILRTHINQLDTSGRRVIVLAYSKGLADTMTALAQYPELAGKVAAVIGIAGVVNGSPVADGRRRLYEATVGKLPYADCPVTDHGEVESLTREFRQNWLATHQLPPGPLYFSLPAVPAPARVSSIFKPFYGELSRIDPRNDGQVIYFDAIIPHSLLLGFANADHFAVALPIAAAMPTVAKVAVEHNAFPRAQLIEAAVVFAERSLDENTHQR